MGCASKATHRARFACMSYRKKECIKKKQDQYMKCNLSNKINYTALHNLITDNVSDTDSSKN